MQCIVLSAQQWKFIDQKSGELRDGTTVWYTVGDSFTPIHIERDKKGFELVKATLAFGTFDLFEQVPGLYDVDLSIFSGSNGKAVIRPTRFTFIKSFQGIDSQGVKK